MGINYAHWFGINLHYLVLYNDAMKNNTGRGSGHTGGDMYDRYVRNIRVNTLVQKQD